MILALGFVAMPAQAVQYMGYPDWGSGFMAPAPTSDTHWDGNDPSPYNTLAYAEGTASQSWSDVTWSCADSWLSVSFGPDLQSGPAWKRKVFIHSTGVVAEPGRCTVWFDGEPWMEWEIFADN